MNRTEKIRLIRSGLKPEIIEPPLFWEFKDGYYTAGNMKLTPKQYKELNKKYPCYE